MKQSDKQKKKPGKKQVVIPMHEATFCDLIEQQIRRITDDCNRLRSLYRTWNYHKGIYSDTTLRTVVIKYLEFYTDQTERDRFLGVQRNIVNGDQLISMPSEQSFFKAYELFRGAWSVRFANRFLQKLKEQQDRGLMIMLGFISMFGRGVWLSSGYADSPFGKVREQSVDSPIPYNAFYSSRIYNNRTIVFNVGVERSPIMDRQQRITRFEYTSYIQFHDVLGDLDMVPMNLQPILKKFCLKVLEDTGRNGFGDDLIKDDKVMRKYKKEDILFDEVQNEAFSNLYSVEKRRLAEGGVNTILPTYFKTTYISNIQASSLVYSAESQRWVTKDALLRAERIKFNEFQRKVNEEILKKYVDFNSAKNLVELLKKIPNFKIKLTEEEKNVVGENGNVMVIGRSGTGKTTCAVLRLFAIEMLFKIRVSLNKKKFGGMLKDTRFMADDIDQAIGLHSIFVTASPVLTNEIERYYNKLTDQIKEELEKKRKRQEQQAKKKLEEEADFRRKEEPSEIMEAQPVQDDSQVEELKPLQVEQVKPEEVQETKTEPKQEEIPKVDISVKEEEEHMNEQFSGIEMEEGQGVEVEEEEDIELEELENKVNKFSSLNDLEETDFPGFFTVRALIMMLDGTLTKPFFVRNQNHQVVGQESKVAWHNEQRGVMMIENYYRKMNAQNEHPEQNVQEIIDEEINYSDEDELEHEYQRQIRLREQRNKQDFTTRLKSKGNNKLSFEVDFDYFAVHFWPQIKKRYYTAKNISAHMIWTEIYSSIKGSANAHLYPASYVPEKVYLEKCSNVFLSVDQKKEIFESFCQYERWKMKLCAYDMMDVVNYILAQMRFRGYAGPSIHYLMIDEVQDLPHATLYLLTKIAEQGVFFSGDTAQTIAKGVGFRFGDLKGMFNNKHFDSELKLTRPSVMQLTVNFRSHNNILQLANSIISIIEILFPATIDRLKKERSDLNGPKPIILADSDIELLFFVLCGEEMYKTQIEKTEGDLLKRPPLQFGCQQVIIVRDQESKKRIPPILQHALCLTIYEAKGLEFNDVILFNFFAESKCADKWNLVKFLKIIDEEVSLKDFEKMVTQHKKMMEQDEEAGKPAVEEVLEETKCIEEVMVGDKVIIKKIKQDSQMVIKDINDFGELCSELKMLYTAITRPRNTLIIYDEDSTSRKPLEKYWDKIGVTQSVTKDMLDLISTSQKKRKGSASAAEVQIFNSLVAKTGAEEWKRQGIKMFKRKYFEQSMKCFQMSGDDDLYKKSQANAMADESTKEIIEVESEKNYIKNKLYAYADMSKQDLKRARTKLKNQEIKALENFCRAGQLFNEAELYKQAGQCFFSGREYAKAEQCFRKINMVKQVAESLYMQHQYIEAGEHFAEGGDYLKAIECYDLVNDWEAVLKIINKFADVIPEADRQALIRKYAALCLEDLVQEIEFENEVPENGGEKKPELVQIIHEKDSDEEEDSELSEQEDSDPEIQAEKEVRKKLSEEISRKQSEQLSRKESEEQLSRKHSEEQFSRKQSEDIAAKKSSEHSEEVQELKPAKEDSSVIELKKDMSDSFANLNESSREQINPVNDSSSSFADLNEPDIEAVKSIADPTDEWIGSSISEIHHKTQSQYSVIDNEQLGFSSHARIIKTKGNIFVQDDVMRRIINIVSIVNSSIVDYLKQLKGHQSLITNSEIQPKEFQLNDFEDVDPEFICRVLDTLESFKIYKLCMFVCNRYHLPSKLGRYLASIALKYSSNALSNMTITPSLLAPNPHRKSELEKGILASFALHTIFENVNPEFLKVKIGDVSKKASETLGEYCVTGLLLEGLYKKVVFMVDVEESLSVLSNYMEADMYRNIFLNNYLKGVDQHTFTFLDHAPKNDTEIELTVLTLEASIWRRLSRLQSELISSYYLKEYHAKELLRQNPLPDYLKFNRSFWKYIENSSGKVERNEFKNCLKEISEVLQSAVDGTNVLAPYVIYDIVTCAILVFHFPAAQELMEQLTVAQFANIYSGVQSLYFLMTNLQAGNPNSWWIIRSMLSVFQARIIQGSKIMRIFGDSYIFIHRSSPIVGDLQDKRRKDLQKHQEKYAGKEKPPKFREEVFFIEQELNIIIAPFFATFKKIRERILKKLVGFSNLYAKMGSLHFQPITMEDHIEQQNRCIFNFFMKDEEVRLRTMIAFLREKNKKQLRQEAKLEARQAELLKAKAHKPSIGMRMLAHTGSLEDEAFLEKDDDAPQKQKQNLDQKLFDSVYLPARTCHPLLKNYMLKKFLSYSRNHKDEIVSGKFLYVTGQNKHYREYTRACGGYFLYDAIEFKLFNRLDMYAFNMQEVMQDLSIEDQCFYTEEILLLLLVHYNSITERGKAIKVELLSSHLKFLEGLKFQEYINKEVYHRDFREAIADGQACIFSCDYRFSSEENAKGIQKLMLDYLHLARTLMTEDEPVPVERILGWYPILISYVVNMNDFSKELFEQLMAMIEDISPHFDKVQREQLESLSLCENEKELVVWRNRLLDGSIQLTDVLFHEVKLRIHSDSKKDVIESESDYNAYDIVLAKRLIATKVIKRWWKRTAKIRKHYDMEEMKARVETKCLSGWPVFLYKLPSQFYPQFLPHTTQLTQELVSFYLENVVTSSLDLHFILMTLNKLVDLRDKFIKLALSDFIEYEAQMVDYEDELRDIDRDILAWKNDEKWSQKNQLNIKKKKVFEIKWLTKVIKKRAGLKKQALLQDKKKMLKRLG